MDLISKVNIDLTSKPAFAIIINRDYGGERYTRIVGVTIDKDIAIHVLNDAYKIAEAAFMQTETHLSNIGDGKANPIRLDNAEYRRISVCVDDPVEPTVEMVSVYLEGTVMYVNAGESAYDNMQYVDDKELGIRYQTGRCDLYEPVFGFTATYKMMDNNQNWITFWKNELTGEVAISYDHGKAPVRIFMNRDDGNKFYKNYIKPRGTTLIPVSELI